MAPNIIAHREWSIKAFIQSGGKWVAIATRKTPTGTEGFNLEHSRFKELIKETKKRIDQQVSPNTEHRTPNTAP